MHLVEPDVNRIDNSLGMQFSPTICRFFVIYNQLKLRYNFVNRIFATVLLVEIFNPNG